jgi:outer membrane receptor for ferrienterochelin and colicin
MRSEATETLLLPKSGKYPVRIAVTIFLLLLGTVIGFSQEFTFHNTPLSEALQTVANRLQIKVAYDAGQLSKIKITKSVETTKPDIALDTLLSGTGYVFEQKFGRYLILLSPGEPSPQKPEYYVHGIVYDRKTGERLPYATVFSIGNETPVFTTVDGTFVLTFADTRHLRILVSYLGYSVLDTVIIPDSSARFEWFGLVQQSRNIGMVNVWGQRLEMLDFGPMAGAITFNPGRFSDLPNFGETDVFRALQILPGIANSESSSQLNIRGGTPDQNLVLFDGFTLYNLDHFFGAFSALNPYVIKNIQVYKGGFDSRYGERVSGIVDITGKTGNTLKPEFSGGVNLISANLSTEIPVTKKLTIVAAGRRAYSDMYSTFLADELIDSKFGQRRAFPDPNANVITPEFYFSDYNLKMTYAPNTDESLSLSMYGSNDFLNNSDTSVRDSFSIETNDQNRWGNYGSGFSWKKQWGRKAFTDLQFGFSGYYNNYENETTVKNEAGEVVSIPSPGRAAPAITSEENRLSDYFISFRNTLFLNQSNRADIGLSAKYNGFDYYKDAGAQFVFDDFGNSSMLYSIFIQDLNTSKNKLTLTPGLRASLYGTTGKFYFEPRLAVGYQLTRSVVLKMATGRYYQFLSKSATEQTYGYNREFWILADKDHPVVSSNHFIAGTTLTTGMFEFDLETYYKTIGGLQEYLFDQNQQGSNPPPNQQPASVRADAPEPVSRFIIGKGKAYGIDFLAKFSSTNFNSLLAFSLSKAERNFEQINNNQNVPALYNHTHELKWTNLWQAGSWHFSSLLVYTSGKPYIVSSIKDNQFIVTRTYSELPDYYRFDFSANYNFTIGKVNLRPGVSIINLFNTDNYYDAYTRRIFVNQTFIDQTTLVKSPGLTLNFFVNFRF